MCRPSDSSSSICAPSFNLFKMTSSTLSPLLFHLFCGGCGVNNDLDDDSVIQRYDCSLDELVLEASNSSMLPSLSLSGNILSVTISVSTSGSVVSGVLEKLCSKQCSCILLADVHKEGQIYCHTF